MAVFVSDTFTDTANTSITSHTGAIGATWVAGTGSDAASRIAGSGVELIAAGTGSPRCYHYASGVPASADYDIEIVWWLLSIGTKEVGVYGRMSTSAETGYLALYEGGFTRWSLYSVVTGSYSLLGSYSQSLTAYTNYTLKLTMVGTALEVFVDGVSRISVTNSAITAVGKAGVRLVGVATDTGGPRISSFTATDSGLGGGGGGGTVNRMMTMMGS